MSNLSVKPQNVDETIVAILVALTRLGVPTDVQELLVHGSLTRGITPHALAKALLSVSALSRLQEGEPVGWSYEYHEFGDVWKRHIILNRPDGNATPPTKHHGSEIRNVRPVYTTPPTQDSVAGWQDISTAPKDGTPFLGFYPEFVGRSYHDTSIQRTVWTGWGGGCWESQFQKGSYEPTHWMPLPAAPVLSNKEG